MLFRWYIRLFCGFEVVRVVVMLFFRVRRFVRWYFECMLSAVFPVSSFARFVASVVSLVFGSSLGPSISELRLGSVTCKSGSSVTSAAFSLFGPPTGGGSFFGSFLVGYRSGIFPLPLPLSGGGWSTGRLSCAGGSMSYSVSVTLVVFDSLLILSFVSVVCSSFSLP